MIQDLNTKTYKFKSLGTKITYPLAISLLLFSLISGWATYSHIYQTELDQMSSFEVQIINVIKAQLAVGTYAENEVIVKEVLNGLLETPYITWAEVTNNKNFQITQGTSDSTKILNIYSIYSPVNTQEIIGKLTLAIDFKSVTQKATVYAMSIAAILVLQTLFVAMILFVFVRKIMGRPLNQLSKQISEIESGSAERLTVDSIHQNDEIGVLCHSANQFLATAEQAINKANQLARTDALTGLNNRRAFFEASENILHQAKRYHWPYTVIMLDIDHFKKINDVYGHENGDKALIAAAESLLEICRDADIVARIGGEEFAILLPETDISNAEKMAQRINEMFTKIEVPIDNEIIKFTVSLGVAAGQLEYKTISVALKHADQALYKAKENGRNCVEIYSNLD